MGAGGNHVSWLSRWTVIRYYRKKKLPKPDINIDGDQVLDITRDNVKKALKGKRKVKRGKAPGEDEGLTVFHKEGGHSMQTAC